MSNFFWQDSRLAAYQQSRGFTLIELLVVILIISIISSFAVLSIHFNKSKQLETLGNQIRNTFLLAEQEALLRQTSLRFKYTETSFQFYEYHESDNPENKAWHPITNATLGLHHLPDNTELTSKPPADDTKDTDTNIIISPSGEVTPFTLYLGSKNAPPLYQIVGTANGDIKSEPVHDEE